jgi:GDPmannose 4,6-dehydratase
MWLMMQQDKPDDYVIATGVTTAVREFIRMAFAEVGMEIVFKGEGINEKGYIVSCSNPDYQIEEGQLVVEVDERYFRPTEVELLIGDASKAKRQLGWEPTCKLPQLVSEMIAGDLDIFKKEKHLMEGGFGSYESSKY